MGLIRPILFIWVILVTCFLGPGCGYQFRTSGEPSGIRIENLSIPLFTSTSSEVGFEADFTRVVRDEFISHARVPLVPEQEAEKVIVGRIYNVRTDPLTYGTGDLTVGGQAAIFDVTRSRNLIVILDVRLVDKRQGKVIWQDPSMTDSVSFTVDPDPLVTRHNHKIALESVARRMAKKIYLRTMERF
jgi:hypothetical protein